MLLFFLSVYRTLLIDPSQVEYFHLTLRLSKLVIPVFFKSDDNHVFSNHRPAVLSYTYTFFLQKILNLFFHNILLNNFLQKALNLTSLQYGCRKYYSTDMVTFNLIDKVSSGLDNKLFTIGIFLDLSYRLLILLIILFCGGSSIYAYDRVQLISLQLVC